jgi:phospholipid transport system substrate-binding protein
MALALIAAAPTDGATQRVRETLDRAQKVAGRDADRNARLEGLRGLARELFDTRAMAVRTLGPQLGDYSDAQRESFFALFDDYIVRAYLQRLLFFKNPEFAFAAPLVEDDGVLVRTRILTPKDEYYVDYRMRDSGAGWLATDIVVEGISLTSNFGEQFRSVLRTRTFDELLELMARKTRKLRDRDGAS